MSYDAAYLAASMIEKANHEWTCEVSNRLNGAVIWIYNQKHILIDFVGSPEYAVHLFKGKAMI